ncbi:glycosyl transferase [Polymorphobacter glacialis]|uniref:Glycosyl transferase n=1 Tax=Sandarakinorhabdus glacialis TaxID=1614636 RepID=A0A916ZQT7_9SPHN|nr:glycosyl transferase [Polymorphobacter glacialis]
MTVTFNSASVLPEFLASLDSQTNTNWTLIAVDNASSDDSVDQLAAWGDPRLQLVRNPANVGFARATNQGLRMAMEQNIEWVLILNNDTSFSPDALAVLMQRASAGDAAVYAPHIVYHRSPAVTWYAGGHFSSAWGFRAELEGEGQSDWPASLKERWTEFAPGCCKLVSTDMLRTSGLFDEDYFVYWEDVDLCWRWSKHGIRIRFLASPVIRHDVSALTGGESSAFSIRMYQLNQVLFLRKNFGKLSIALRLVPIVSKIALCFILRKDSLSQSRARLAAIAEGLRYALVQIGDQSCLNNPIAARPAP